MAFVDKSGAVFIDPKGVGFEDHVDVKHHGGAVEFIVKGVGGSCAF